MPIAVGCRLFSCRTQCAPWASRPATSSQPPAPPNAITTQRAPHHRHNKPQTNIFHTVLAHSNHISTNN